MFIRINETTFWEILRAWFTFLLCFNFIVTFDTFTLVTYKFSCWTSCTTGAFIHLRTGCARDMTCLTFSNVTSIIVSYHTFTFFVFHFSMIFFRTSRTFIFLIKSSNPRCFAFSAGVMTNIKSIYSNNWIYISNNNFVFLTTINRRSDVSTITIIGKWWLVF